MKANMKGFIVVEGPDGAGKTTVANKISKRLRELFGKSKIVKTKEPYKIDVNDIVGLSPEDIYKKFIEDRKNHVEQVILPAMSKGKIVISDRYWYSTYVYQSIMGIQKKRIIDDNKDFVQPDIALFLLPPVEVIAKRITMKDKFDQYALERLEEIRKTYFEAAEIARSLGTKAIIIEEKEVDVEKIIFDINL